MFHKNAVSHWLTHIDPRTMCPPMLSDTVFCQIASDIDVDLHVRLATIHREWIALRVECTEHPAVRAMAIAGVDYMRTVFCLFSLCLPDGCTFRGREPATSRLKTMYQRLFFPLQFVV